MAFCTFHETTASATNTPGTSHTINYPTTVNDGDLLIYDGAWNANNTITLAANWTRLANNAAGNPGTIEVWARIAPVSNTLGGTTFTITSSASQASGSQIRRYSGNLGGLVAGTDYDIAAVAAWVSASSAPDPPSVTATWGSDDNTFIAIGGGNGANRTATTAPANYINLASSASTNGGGGGASVYSADRQLAAATDNPGTFALSGTDRVFAYTLVIRPAASGVTASPARAGLLLGARTPTGTLTIGPEARAGLRLGLHLPTVVRPQPPVFPNANLDLTVELAFGAENNPPTDWTWTDVTDELPERIHRQTISPKRGRADESAVAGPSSVSMTFDNIDGNLSPRNPSSVYWPNVIRGTPLRIAVDAGAPALLLSGAGSVSTPDHPDFEVTDLDIRMQLQPTAWAHPVDWALGGGSRSISDIHYHLVSKWNNTGDQRAWLLDVFSAGWPAIFWSVDGTAGTNRLDWSTELFAALRPAWIGMTIDVDDGAAGHQTTLYRFDGATPPADVTTWEVVDQTTTAGVTSINRGTAPVRIGATDAHTSFLGRVQKLEIRNGINGTVVADPDFTASQVGDNALEDSTGKIWTLAGDAQISRRRYRYVGNIDDWNGPEWPHGDNEPGNEARNSESRVSVTASGILRRLGQGARSKPIRSTLYRHIRGARVAADVLDYWPCEDAQSAIQFGSGVPEGNAATVAGATLASDDSLLASAPLPAVEAGKVSTWSVAIDTGTTSATRWVVEWLWRLETPETNPTFTRLITIKAAGGAAEFQISINDTNVLVNVLDSVGTNIDSSAVATSTTFHDGWVIGRLEVQQDGADIDWERTFIPVDTGTASSGTGTILATTMGQLTEVGNVVTGPTGGYRWGHVVVTNGDLAVGWMAGADTAWVGESAAHRIWRLCNEESIPIEIIGDGAASTISGTSIRGDLLASEPMGPQERKSLVQLIRDAVLLDLGMLIERRGIPGLIYRCRNTLEAQSPILELDAARNSRGDIVNPLEPRLDDQNLLNDVTFGANFGSSAQVIDQAHIDAEGLYDAQLTLGGVGGVDVQDAILATQAGLSDAVDDQNLYQAAWRVALGTWPELRWPSVTIPLETAAVFFPGIIDVWLDVELGDRITLGNLPVQYPDETIELIVDHVAENMSPTRWRPVLTCSPGGLWLIGLLDA